MLRLLWKTSRCWTGRAAVEGRLALMGVTPRLLCARTAATTCSGMTTIRPPPRQGLLRSWYLTTLLGSSSTPSTCSNWSSCREYLKLLYLQQTWKNYIKMCHDSYMRAWWIMMKNVFEMNWAAARFWDHMRIFVYVVYVYDLILIWVGKSNSSRATKWASISIFNRWV